MKSAILIFPGSNRELDIAEALKASTGSKPLLVWHKETKLPAVDLIVLPGGFSYGDYLRPGAIAAHSPIMQAVVAEAQKGRPVLGICNGFQILTEAGLLPGVLRRNQTLRFVCRDIHVRVETNASIFTQGLGCGEVLRIPIAHADGNYFASQTILKTLEDEERIAFRYVDATGILCEESNPNGSLSSIAGVFDSTRRVLGLMPHLENAIDPAIGSVDGRMFFTALVKTMG